MLRVQMFQRMGGQEILFAVPSAKYPDHSFKIGRLFSRYHGGGFNRVLMNRGVPDLNEIFKPLSPGPHEFTPNWNLARELAWKSLGMYKASLSLPMGNVDVLCVRQNMYTKVLDVPEDESEALSIMRDELQKMKSSEHAEGQMPDGQGHTSVHGYFFPTGIKVVAAVAGFASFMGPRYPCTYLAIQRDLDGPDWYEQGLYIVLETCDYVLKAESTNEFQLRWLT